VGLGDLRRAVVDAHVPVAVEHRRRVRCVKTVNLASGQPSEEVFSLAGDCQCGDLAADGLALRGRLGPAPGPPDASGSILVAPSARGSPARTRSTASTSIVSNPEKSLATAGNPLAGNRRKTLRRGRVTRGLQDWQAKQQPHQRDPPGQTPAPRPRVRAFPEVRRVSLSDSPKAAR
jgi:hypothetical protein